MTPKRNRSLHVSVGVMTALSLGVASLAGCASFDPNPAATGQAPVTTTGATPAQPSQGGGAATPAQPAVALSNLSGTATFAGKPLANATVTVYNALTDKPISGLVAAGAGNLVAAGAGNLVAAGAGNLVAAGAGNYGLTQATTLKTDANGNYDVNVPELKDSDLVRVVVRSDDGKVIMNALAGGAVDKASYAIKQATTTSSGRRKDFKIKVDVATTVAAGLMSGFVVMLKGMSEENRKNAIDGFVENVAKVEANFGRTLVDPAAQEAVMAGVIGALTTTGGDMDAVGGGVAQFAQIKEILAANGFADAAGEDFQALVAETLKEVLAAAVDGLKEVELSKEDFPPEININLDNLNEITFDDPVSGEPVVIDVEIIEEVEEEPIGDSTPGEAKFSQVITLEYNTKASEANAPLRMTVTQDDGELDVKTITATLPMSYVASTNLAQTAGTVVNDTTETLLSGGWADFGDKTTHKIFAEAGNSATSFDGVWKVGTTTIADVKITKSTSELKVVFDFLMSGNEALETVGGTITLAALKSLVELKVSELDLQTPISQPVVITIDSRTGADLTATTTDGGFRSVFHRNITVVK